MPAGRPTTYKKKYGQMMIDWFDRELTVLKDVQRVEYGKVVVVQEEAPNKPPMFGVFARKVIGVYYQTLVDWKHKYPEFNDAYNECKRIQQEFIIMGCLMGHLNANFGRFTMKNISTWRDNVTDQVTTAKGGIALAYKRPEKAS